ncbi:putative C-type lectin domain family 20 member A [Ictalurus furcatus]|uniref:putative C-type lectin domain family 20 member A n=1 Tax=Ictalurus furcatus TaxID=66913 RepID=UPI002351028C|nr:putative C-type lectin domain family 20 member A [Ictalurus furcatus]
MEQRLFILLFFTGVISLVLSVPRKYFLIQKGKTWSDAQAYCRVTYTDLAIIESNENMVELQYEAQRQQFSSSAWLGMYNDINSWRWSFGNEPLTTGMMWLGGWPNNNGGHQECGATSTWGWICQDCTTTRPFVCFNDTKTGNKVYIYISNKMTWYDAQAYCRTHHVDLASSRNATENSNIQRMTMQKIMMVKVRSSQDVNDPAVLVAILEQIKQKLKDHGIAENITVKWREQPDGSVFHKE